MNLRTNSWSTVQLLESVRQSLQDTVNLLENTSTEHLERKIGSLAILTAELDYTIEALLEVSNMDSSPVKLSAEHLT